MAQYLQRNGLSFIKLINPPVNGFSLAVREGVMRCLEQARQEKSNGVVIFGDGKNFSAGADISEFSKGKHLIQPSLNEVIDTLDNFNKPIVACINGVALGGGLEVALSCHWRVATSPSIFGLPEVNLGILPGAGGTQRLPRLIGIDKALEIIVSGRNITSSEALKLGIIDEITSLQSQDDILDVAEKFILSERVQSTPLSNRRISSKVITDISKEQLNTLEANVNSTSRGFIAPIKIAKAVRAAVEESSFRNGLQRERELFSELSSGSQARALQYLFFSERKVSSPTLNTDPTKIPKISTVGVIGGGTMGAGIAMSFAEAGLPVILVETSAENAANTRKRIDQTYRSSSAFKSGKMDESKVEKLLNKINFTNDFNSLSSVDIVVEAVFENMNTKKDIFRKLDSVCHPNAILATNTSYLDIDEIGSVTSRPSQVIGTHFFSPANVMKLLEVVRGKNTSPEVISACMQLGKQAKKVPVLAGNCFGFIGNRMLEFYGKEAQFLVEEGATPTQVDRALKSVGMAMGFFEMSDLAGGDVGWRLRLGYNLVGENATGRKPNVRYSSMADKMCDQGWFGQKTKKGWYLYDPSAPRKPLENIDTLNLIENHRRDSGITARTITDQEVIERCLYSLFNEGCRILEEGIAASPADIDVVYIYGYGFPRYRGGPMWWGENEVGLSNILQALTIYSSKYPQQPHLQPSKLLIDAVKGGKSLLQTLQQK
mmetsp:Transcript_24821/g.25449  ORF Transcript_24821/g.25449 Transcript_24821/m.25449 type:complete len:716 (-) Transcript_24821:46-2193(-)|eukprot:CAMPEP_0174818346 /NCGR_PEP_ID=MMETSP1107-20130205/1009_1 /TAXON_ID=36770 /ORGANISM="Paraphysomonas vestita, Strain GFlagA" /LENGTH=715 /DNA_ID=CAMNT_0016030069 /DNA_START=78 /DNA_END=2225 /DNA_ORIENTATION=+